MSVGFAHTMVLFLVTFIWLPSWVDGNIYETQDGCLLKSLNKRVEAYYNAVNAGNEEAMYIIESEEYKQRHPMGYSEPELLEMKRKGRFDKLFVKSVELIKGDMAKALVDFLIFNKTEGVWDIDGSFIQVWKCQRGRWFVDSPPKVILLK